MTLLHFAAGTFSSFKGLFSDTKRPARDPKLQLLAGTSSKKQAASNSSNNKDKKKIKEQQQQK